MSKYSSNVKYAIIWTEDVSDEIKEYYSLQNEFYNQILICGDDIEQIKKRINQKALKYATNGYRILLITSNPELLKYYYN